MKINKKVLSLICGSLTIMALTVGCSEGSQAIYEDEIKSKEAVAQANSIVGSAEITNFTEKKNLKEILELRDDPNLICYYYTKNTMSGKYVYQGRCQGYGIPYASSMTNPEESIGSGATLPLADPNGMYMQGLTTSATFIMHIGDKTNEKEPRYVEEEIMVSKTKVDKRLCEDWSLPSNY